MASESPLQPVDSIIIVICPMASKILFISAFYWRIHSSVIGSNNIKSAKSR